MLGLVERLAIEVVRALLPAIIKGVREGKDEAAIRRTAMIQAKRKAIELAHDALAKELRKR